MKIIFDLDYTLLDTAKFKEALAEAVTSFGVSRQRYEETYKQVVRREGKTYDYDPDAHFAALANDFPSPAARAGARRGIDGVLAAADKYLYPGAAELLGRLRAAGNHLTLLTLGNEKWQSAKIDHSGLRRFFDDVVTTGEKKTLSAYRLASRDEKVIVVNDNGEELMEMKNLMPNFTYLLRRGPKPTPDDLSVPAADDIAGIEAFLAREGAFGD